MIFYKILHIKTGLFYGPNSGLSTHRNNLFKKGKIYHQKPSLKIIGEFYGYKGERLEFKIDDFKIIEYNVKDENK